MVDNAEAGSAPATGQGHGQQAADDLAEKPASEWLLLLLMLMLMHRRPGVLPMAVPCTSHQKAVGPPRGHTLWWQLSATEHPILR